MEEIEKKTEPFFDDLLYRKNLAENFKKVLLGTDLNVFSLTAPWGSGKTYFIENLVKLMGDDSVCILYNAWESDFYDNPLIPLLVELLNKIESLYEKTDLEQDIVTIKELFKNLTSKLSFQAGINFNVVNFGVTFDPSKKMIDSEYIELKNLIKSFRMKLQIIQEKLNKKIIIFIDELDRCHPMYTIKTLEVIKHFFGIPNVIFVLSVDKTQIENSVRTIYGVNVGEESGYLRKFIDAEFRLFTQNSNELVSSYVDKLLPKFEKFIVKDFYGRQTRRYFFSTPLKQPIPERNILISIILEISNLLNMSSRDLERYFCRLGLLLDSFSVNDLLFVEPVLILSALLVQNEKEYDYYSKNHETELVTKINGKLQNWKGLLTGSYKEELDSYHRRSASNPTQIQELSWNLYNLFNSYGMNDIEQQKMYLENYLIRIKFINNFNTL